MKKAVFGMVVAAALCGFAEEKNVHVLQDGYVSWRAVEFSARKGTDNAKWVIVPDEGTVIDFTSGEGIYGSFLQQQPKKKVKQIEAVVEYRVKIGEPGKYELSYIGGGIDKESDSAFVRIKELAGEYLQLGGWGREPALQSWRTVQMRFEIPVAGVYTIEIGNREAGYCLQELSLTLSFY